MSSARRIGRALAGGGKATAVGGGAGVATYYLHKMLATKVEAIGKHTILSPLALIAGGHLIKRRMPTVGAGLVGAGGYALGLALDMRAQSQKAAAGNTGALLESSNVGALLEARNVGDYVIPDAGAEDDSSEVDYSSAMNLTT